MLLVRLLRSRRCHLLVLTAGLVYLLTQSAGLQHTHDGRLDLQSDCHICLKLGTADDGIPVAYAVQAIDATAQSYPAPALNLVFLSAPTARSRAPPAPTA
jgi:hypothetical protein